MRRALSTLRAVDRAFEALERFVLSAGVLGMAAASVANVLSRNLLDRPLTFADEVNQILIVLVTFLGIGYGVRHARHIRMSAFYDQLRGSARKGLLVLTQLGTAALLFALAGYAVAYVASVYAVGSVTPALRLPLWLVYAVAPLGLLLGGVQYGLAAVRNLASDGLYAAFDREESYVEAPGGSSGGVV